jgi:hypothetical protein
MHIKRNTHIDSNSVPAVRCPTVAGSSSCPMRPQGVCLGGRALVLSDSHRREGRCCLRADAYIGGTEMKRERESEREGEKEREIEGERGRES